MPLRGVRHASLPGAALQLPGHCCLASLDCIFARDLMALNLCYAGPGAATYIDLTYIAALSLPFWHTSRREDDRTDICDLQTFVDCLEDAVVIIDGDYRILLANAAVSHSLSLASGTILNQPCYHILRDEPAPCAGRPFGACAMQKVRATGRPARVRQIYTDQAGSMHALAIYAAPLAGLRAGPPLVLQVMHEITQQAEPGVEAAQGAEAERARSLEAANLRLRALEQACRQAFQRTMTAQEDERRRIAAELHDETAQGLAALVVGLDTAAAMLERDAAAAGRQLARLKTSAGAMIDEIDAIIAALRPALLDDLGLVPALRAYAADRLDPLGVAWEFDAVDYDPRPQRATDLVLFRVVQEAISNIARHAQALRVLISLSVEADGIAVRICDDGVGFDLGDKLEPARRPSCFGLLGMRERLAAVNGRLDIQSHPGRGTQLLIFVPSPTEGEVR
jgi:signal transduction histidine kinase